MMVIKGDFNIYDPRAAKAAVSCLAQNVVETEEEIPEIVYELVEKKMYCNIIRILMTQKYPKHEKICEDRNLQKFIEWSYRDAKARRKDP